MKILHVLSLLSSKSLRFDKVAQDSGTHDSKTEEAEKVKNFVDQFLCKYVVVLS